MKKTIILALILTGFLAFLTPNVSKVSAVTLADLQNQIQQLLKILLQLQQQLLEIIKNQNQGQCGWCGNTCTRKTTGMSCPNVMPPSGYECKEVNGNCTSLPITNFNNCNTLSGRYFLTLQEAYDIFRNSECRNLGDPTKLATKCIQCDPKKEYSNLYNAIYGEDTTLLDKAIYQIGNCDIDIQSKTARIDKGFPLCRLSTDVESERTIICALQDTSQEGWYSLEGEAGTVHEIKLLKLKKCSNCQLRINCSELLGKVTFTDTCTNEVIASYGGELNCKKIGVPPENIDYIQELIKNYYSIKTCTDSDEGKNDINTKGTVTYQGHIYTDFCGANNVLTEYWCGPGMGTTTHTCAYKCEDGRCILPLQSTCEATCKVLGFASGKCDTHCPLGDYASPPQENIGETPDCAGPEFCCCKREARYSCVPLDDQVQWGGGNYKYDPKGQFTSVKDAQQNCPLPSCTDSDGGNNIYIKGIVTEKGITQSREHADYCLNSTQVMEVNCSNDYWNVWTSTPIACPVGYLCQDGSCVPRK